MCLRVGDQSASHVFMVARRWSNGHPGTERAEGEMLVIGLCLELRAAPPPRRSPFRTARPGESIGHHLASKLLSRRLQLVTAARPESGPASAEVRPERAASRRLPGVIFRPGGRPAARPSRTCSRKGPRPPWSREELPTLSPAIPSDASGLAISLGSAGAEPRPVARTCRAARAKRRAAPSHGKAGGPAPLSAQPAIVNA